MHATFWSFSEMSLSFSLGKPFAASHISVKGWPSDKVKENCETTLKVHYVMQLSLWGDKVFRWVMGFS